MKKILLFFLLITSLGFAQALYFPGGKILGPGFAPMQRGSVIEPLGPLAGRSGTEALAAYWYQDNFVSPGVGQGVAYWKDRVSGIVASFPNDVYKPTASGGVYFVSLGTTQFGQSYLKVAQSAAASVLPQGLASMTILVRYKIKTQVASARIGALVTYGSRGPGMGGYWHALECDDTYRSRKPLFIPGGAEVTGLGNPDVVGEWKIIAMTFDASNGQTNYYENGTNLATQTRTISHITIDSQGLLIGTAGGSDTNHVDFSGYLWEVAIFRKALSPTEIQSWTVKQ